ncbi:MAG TPA: hypothetical protein PLS49_07290 [Candidatus Woesebacteria bacterium]|nr:hypothetical protein [Candidatus Woesebacteria bacterium]
MERKVIFTKQELYSFPHNNLNVAYNTKRKIDNASSAFVLGENEELDVSVRPEITDEGKEEWNVDLSVKQFYPANTLINLLDSQK